MSMVSTQEHAAPLALQFVALTKHIGCEVKGIDLRKPVPPAAASAIYRAWLDHAVLLFRGQELTQEDLIRVTGIFGAFAPLGRPAHTLPKGFAKILPNIMLISNIRENGKPIGALPDGEMHFHTDQCHQERPAMASMLYALEVPSTGGNTLFANGYAAYATLPDGIKRRVEGRKALNAYDYDSAAMKRGTRPAEGVPS